MFKHRPGEGVYARGTALWCLVGFAFLAGRRFYYWSQGWNANWPHRALVSEIPVVGMPLTPSLLMGVGVFLLACLGAWKLVAAPKISDILIDTELEMKKVTWPSFDESRKASFVVIFCVVVMVAFLTVSDLGLEWFFFNVVYGGGANGR
jgi:preprotein translocase SecE subunit